MTKTFWTSLLMLAPVMALPLTMAACASTPEPPPWITLSSDPLRVTVEQRKSKEVPELNVRFRLGDVADKRVLFEVGVKGSDPLVTKRSISLHGTKQMVLGPQTFLITLAEVHIVPGGTDFAVFEISDVTPQPEPVPEPGPELAPTLEPDETIAEEDEAGGPPELPDDEPGEDP